MKHKSTDRHQTTQQTGTDKARGGRLRAGVAAVALLGIAACHDGSTRSEEASISATGESIRIFAGIPQNGIVLGDPRAPITLTEFSDLSCSHCRHYALQVLPEIVNRYVRTGQVRLVFRNLAFLGTGSVRAARMAGAVGLQNHLWEFVDVLFRDQNQPDAQRIDDQLLRRITATLPDVDVVRALADRDDASVAQQLSEANKEATRLDIHGVPAFFVGKTGEKPRRLRLTSMSSKPFSSAFAELLRSSPLDARPR